MRIWITILLTLLINILCIPLWTECDYVGFVRTLFNEETRLDLLYRGKITGVEPFHFQSTPRPFYTTWKYEPGLNIHRNNLSLRVRGEWQKLSLQVEALRDGEITVILRGPEEQDEYGSFHSILVDWRNFKINGEIVFDETKVFSLTKKFTQHISIKKDEILNIEAEFRKHQFTIHDFTWLSSGNLWFLITGNLLFFFLIMQLLNYFIRGRDRLRLGDTLLVVTFFICLFIPMMNISNELKSQRENRTLAEKPTLEEILKGKVNTGGGYERWFNDHFCGRVLLIKLHDTIRNKLSRIIRSQGAVYFKEGGWEFFSPFVRDWDHKLISSYSIVHNLIQLHQFCQQHRIRLYVLETPRKERIYKELIINKYGIDNNQFVKTSQEQEAIRAEARIRKIPWIYPYKELRDAAKQDFVFYKWKHHWTDWGAFVGYRELMKEVQKDFPDIPVSSLDDYNKTQSWLIRDEYKRSHDLGRHLYQLFNDEDQDDPPNRTLYNYYDHKDADKTAIKVGKFTKEFSRPDGKYKVMLIGTSQNEGILQFLPYSTTYVKYIRLNMKQVRTSDEFKVMKLYKKDILAYKPEILILSIEEDSLYKLHDLCSTK